MESLISIDFRNYNSTESPLNCLNELNLDDFQDLYKFSEMLTTKYADKTFINKYIIRHIRQLFGNYSALNIYFKDLVFPFLYSNFFSANSDKSTLAVLSAISYRFAYSSPVISPFDL